MEKINAKDKASEEKEITVMNRGSMPKRQRWWRKERPNKGSVQ